MEKSIGYTKALSEARTNVQGGAKNLEKSIFPNFIFTTLNYIKKL